MIRIGNGCAHGITARVDRRRGTAVVGHAVAQTRWTRGRRHGVRLTVVDRAACDRINRDRSSIGIDRQRAAGLYRYVVCIGSDRHNVVLADRDRWCGRERIRHGVADEGHAVTDDNRTRCRRDQRDCTAAIGAMDFAVHIDFIERDGFATDDADKQGAGYAAGVVRIIHRGLQAVTAGCGRCRRAAVVANIDRTGQRRRRRCRDHLGAAAESARDHTTACTINADGCCRLGDHKHTAGAAMVIAGRVDAHAIAAGVAWRYGAAGTGAIRSAPVGHRLRHVARGRCHRHCARTAIVDLAQIAQREADFVRANRDRCRCLAGVQRRQVGRIQHFVKQAVAAFAVKDRLPCRRGVVAIRQQEAGSRPEVSHQSTIRGSRGSPWQLLIIAADLVVEIDIAGLQCDWCRRCCRRIAQGDAHDHLAEIDTTTAIAQRGGRQQRLLGLAGSSAVVADRGIRYGRATAARRVIHGGGVHRGVIRTDQIELHAIFAGLEA